MKRLIIIFAISVIILGIGTFLYNLIWNKNQSDSFNQNLRNMNKETTLRTRPGVPQLQIRTEADLAIPKPIVVDGTVINDLAFLTSTESENDIKSLVSGFGGKIVVSIPETGTYEVRFPVNTLTELDNIAIQLRQKTSIRIVHSYVTRPTNPNGPQ